MYWALPHLTSIFHKRRPIQLTFFVTRRCNARCPWCFYLQGNDQPCSAGEELRLDEIDALSRSLGRLLWLAFSGGEVFLRRDLVEIAELFHARNRPSVMLFPTNGMMPELIERQTRRILQRCPHSVVVVKLSLDGLGGAHDALRDTPGCFARTLDTYHRLRALRRAYPRLELGFNTVFLSGNQDQMDHIMQFVASLEGAPAHTISLVRGDLARHEFKAVDASKYGEVVARLEQSLQKRSAATYGFFGAQLKAAQDVVQRRLIHRTLRSGQRQIPCHAGRINLVLSETGEVFPCEMRGESFGNVRDHGYDLRRVCRTLAARTTLDSIRRAEFHCTHECYMKSKILFSPRV
ncbi:MAG: radical SAM protein [Pseudomonadota bacterium]|nr:MAG: radical SAM protein [Pseudomonadota bacterium]